MADQVSESGNSESTRRSVQRGRTSPAHALEDAVSGVKQVFEALGTTRHQRDDAAQAMGYKPGSGAANSRVGSLTHFGLLDRHGAEYEVSDLARQILTPENDDERKQAIADAAISPSLYGELVQQFDGQPLPPMLSNILQRNYGVVPKSASDVASRFEETLRFAGLLRDGKVHATLKDAGEPGGGDKDLNQLKGNEATRPDNQGDSQSTSRSKLQVPPDAADYRIPLRGKRSALLYLPSTVDESDIDRIKSWFDLMADVLTEEQVEEEVSEATDE